MNTNFRAAPQQNASQGVTKVPAGVYVAKIVGVKEEADQYGPQLKLALDIAEGEYADAYKRRYEADVEYARNNPGNSREAKWKGTIKYRIPEGRDPEHDSRNEARLNDALWRIEQSNPGLRIDWAHLEEQLKGKLVGINVRDAEYNGQPYTEIGRLEIAEEVRTGAVRTMNPRQSAGQAQQAPAAAAYTPVATPPELPF